MAKKKTRIPIVTGAIIGLIAVLFAKKKPPSSPEDDGAPDRPEPSAKGWSSKADNDLVLSLAERVVDITGWIELPSYLLAVSYTESRGNPDAGVWTKDNKARGLFGLRPNSALAYELEHLRDQPNLLHDPRWAVALAAWYAHRMQKYKAPRQTLDWLAIRRGWALPRLVSDVNETAVVDAIKPGTDPPRKYRPGERSADVRERFEIALDHSGLPEEFMYNRAIPPGYDWPGIKAVLRAVGLDRVT